MMKQKKFEYERKSVQVQQVPIDTESVFMMRTGARLCAFAKHNEFCYIGI